MNEFIDLIPEFVEESLEHLKNIEEDIIIIEQGNADNELINRVFRAVHSIKGGSSFLGLRNIERLSHKMEDIFNLVRNDELTFSSDISSCVLTSIDRLREMLAHSGDSDSYDISGNLEALSRCLGQKSMDDIARKIKKDIEESTVKIDQSKLAHLRKQGKKVYMVHFELRDDQLGSKRPLDFFGEIEKTGDVLVRNVDMELVLRDAEFTGQGIPLNILYATVLERDLVAHIFAIDEKQVKEIKPDSLMEEEVIESAGADEAEIDEAYYVEMESYLKRKGSIDDVAPAAEEPEPPREPEEEPREIQPRQPLPPDPPPPVIDAREEEEDEEPEEMLVAEDVREAVVQDEDDDESYQEDSDEIKEINDYLTFLVDEEEYGIGITQVQEIVTLQEITRVPDSEDYTRGIINLRGDIIPVYDFRLRLQFAEREYDEKTVILIAVVMDKKVGIVVDRVSEVIQLNRQDISEAPQMHDIPANYLIGIGQKDDKFVVLLKLKEIFDTTNTTEVG